jgi:translation initiation factor IF-2
MSATVPDTKPPDQNSSATPATAVPKRITNAQTVCNEKNEKGKLCNGHLKQLRTAGEPSEVHLRGDDVLSKCQTCGTFYMGPPLGHVRDPQKQSRFVEAELTALLQAAGGTMPIIKKDARGVYVLAEAGGEHGHAAKPGPAKPAAPAAAALQPGAATTGAAKPSPAPDAKASEQKAGAQPNRQLFKRSTYAGVTDTGPVPGETFEQKVARLKAVSLAAKQRAEEGGATTAPAAPAAVASEPAIASVQDPSPAAAPIPQEDSAPASTASAATAAHKPTGNADRTLMKRYTYCGVVDTGPVPGETFEQKVARLAALSAAAKQRSEGGG